MGVWRGVRADVRKRARAEAHKWALGARYWIEQVFGVVKGVCGSSVRCRSSRLACVRVWRMWVLWHMVQLVKVGGLSWMWGRVCFACGKGIFRTPSSVQESVRKKTPDSGAADVQVIPFNESEKRTHFHALHHY